MKCIRCHHPMKHARPSGMGEVCEAKARMAPVDVELFGYDIDRAAVAADEGIRSHVVRWATAERASVRADFRALRQRLEAIQ